MIHTAARHFTFMAKIAGAVTLIGLANFFFYDEEPGWTLGGFALVWMVVLTLVRPDVRRSKEARMSLVVAAGFGLALVNDPGPLPWCLFWAAIASATLLPLHRFNDALRWGARLLIHALLGLAAPIRDAKRLAFAGRGGGTARAIAAALVLPIGGGSVFLALFATANPLIGNAFAAVHFPDLSSAALHLVFWAVVLLAVWPNLRPRKTILRFADWAPAAGASVPHVPLATLTFSLIIFNAVFAVENALDLTFLWSGARLPDGVTLAEYAHRGAYPLIATALLAAGFVLLAARPGSAGAGNTAVRRLIVAWVAQNVLLVASSILRTLDYIAAYSLTPLRIAALAWMGLVALGLLLIVYRMLTGRSTRWLVNANALAMALVLAAGSVSDLGNIAAAWNVRHALRAEDLDLCYLERLGPSALLPLVALERRAGGPRLRDTAASMRTRTMARLKTYQADWRAWSWRGARRLALASVRLGERPYQPRPLLNCLGRLPGEDGD